MSSFKLQLQIFHLPVANMQLLQVDSDFQKDIPNSGHPSGNNCLQTLIKYSDNGFRINKKEETLELWISTDFNIKFSQHCHQTQCIYCSICLWGFNPSLAKKDLQWRAKTLGWKKSDSPTAYLKNQPLNASLKQQKVTEINKQKKVITIPRLAVRNFGPILESLPMAFETSDTSAPVASQMADMELMLEMRWARNAFAA